MLTTLLLAIPIKWKQPRRPLLVVGAYAVKPCSEVLLSLEKEWRLTHAAPDTNLESMMSSEGRLAWGASHCMVPLTGEEANPWDKSEGSGAGNWALLAARFYLGDGMSRDMAEEIAVQCVNVLDAMEHCTIISLCYELFLS